MVLTTFALRLVSTPVTTAFLYSSFTTISSSIRRNTIIGQSCAFEVFGVNASNKRRRRIPTITTTTKPTTNISSRLFNSKKNTDQISQSQYDLIHLLEQEPLLTSTKSQTCKLYQSLSTKAKVRNEQQMTVIEGHRLIIDTISDKDIQHLCHDIVVTRDALLHETLGESLSECLQSISGQCQVRMVNDQVMKSASGTVTPQGVAAIMRIPPSYQHKNHVITRSDNIGTSSSSKNKLFVIFDGLQDPGNVGTLLRSSVAVGVEAVIFLPGSCDCWNPKAVRSAMSCSFKVPVCTVSNWDECLELLQESGVDAQNIYAATMEGEEDSDRSNSSGSYKSIAHYDLDWTGLSSNCAIVLGKEGSGLSRIVRDAVSSGKIRSVHVPMEGGIESLNAGVCGSVIMFEYYRRQCMK